MTNLKGGDKPHRRAGLGLLRNANRRRVAVGN